MFQFHRKQGRLRSKTFDGHIWTIRADPHSAAVAIQFRNSNEKTASCCWLSLGSGKFGPIFTPSNSWWTELVGVAADCVFLSRYSDPAFPVSNGLIVWEGRKGKYLWEIESGRLAGLAPHSALVLQKEGFQFDLHQISDGRLLESYLDELPENLEMWLFTSPQYAEMGPLFPDHSDFQANQSLTLSPNAFPGIGIHSMVHLHYQIVAWHSGSVGDWTQWLEVTSSGDSIVKVELENKMPKLNPEPFFLFKNFLVFIRNRNELNWVELK